MTTTFSELGVPAPLVERLTALGITAPFPIQHLTLADALAGRDLCGKAPTGSGKTLAFSLPVAVRVARGAPKRPRALLLVPTRELASQVSEVLAPLLEVQGRNVVTLYGGTSVNRDRQRLAKRVDVVVATPGRLEDLLQQRALTLGDVDLAVIDEADRMADMGFLPVVRRILDQTSAKRQTLLFSATLDGDVDVLVRRYQNKPARHEFDTPAEKRGDVRHVFWAAERAERRKLTAKIVRETGPAIVFTRTKHGADRLAKQLAQDGITTAAIHGNRSQNQRESALARFADGRVHVLVATDVAARGIHVDDVAAVVHYDQPATDKDYVHRSGRTGRAGAEGLVVSLVGAEERKDVQKLQRDLSLPEGLHDLELSLLRGGTLPTPRRDAAASHVPHERRGGGNASKNGGPAPAASRRRARHGRSGGDTTGGQGGNRAGSQTRSQSGGNGRNQAGDGHQGGQPGSGRKRARRR